ncbi:MAG TPA: hypothetical protein VMT17_14065 [Anaeromyxobacteraceae bacterium]|nr:hypothetical protein [Anaeromyxobacteraceae bacterium]
MRAARRWLGAALLAAWAAAPGETRADRGGLTLELGPSLAVSPRWPVPLRGATGFAAAAPGLVAGLRYATSNELELTLAGLFEAPAGGVASVVDGGGVVVSTASASVSTWGALFGVRFVFGLAWRFHLAAEMGWQHLACTRLSASDDAGGGTAGGGGRDALALAVGAGLDWQATDRLSLALAPRLELLPGAPAVVIVLVPVTLGYSWYVF